MVIQNLVIGKGFSGEPVKWKLVRSSQDGTEKGWLFFFCFFFPFYFIF